MLKMSLQRLPESHLASRPLEGVLGGADFMRIYAGPALLPSQGDLWRSRFYAYLRRSHPLCLVKVTYGGADFMRIYAGPTLFA